MDRITKLEKLVATFFANHRIPDEHGVVHSRNVVAWAEKAISHMTIPPNVKLCILAAAMLHDVDDRKYFKGNEYANAPALLSAVDWPHEEYSLIIEMIDIVSCSRNGNSTASPLWKLIPRDADRLEAIGEVGVQRCMAYTEETKRPIMIAGVTPLPVTDAELDTVACESRFREYCRTGRSASFIDHFYDKLLHIGTMGSGSALLQSEADRRMRYMRNYLLEKNKTLIA